MKKPGSVQGQPFVIDNCNDCTLLVLDHCAQAQIDNVSNSKIFIGASADSVFVRNCSDCTFTVACGQLRTRDCQNCTFNLYCKTEPVIETSLNMKFGPFNGVYPGHRGDLLDAGLEKDVSDCNDDKWQNVFDFLMIRPRRARRTGDFYDPTNDKHCGVLLVRLNCASSQVVATLLLLNVKSWLLRNAMQLLMITILRNQRLVLHLPKMKIRRKRVLLFTRSKHDSYREVGVSCGLQ